MPQHLIFWPVLIQALLPLIVIIVNGKRKREEVAAGKTNKEEASLNNDAWGIPVVLTSRNIANQFQFPVLFYVVCLVLFAIQSVTWFALGLAWLFVCARIAHAWIHITSNYVPLRLRYFILGIVFLLCLLVNAMYQLASL